MPRDDRDLLRHQEMQAALQLLESMHALGERATVFETQTEDEQPVAICSLILPPPMAYKLLESVRCQSGRPDAGARAPAPGGRFN